LVVAIKTISIFLVLPLLGVFHDTSQFGVFGPSCYEMVSKKENISCTFTNILGNIKKYINNMGILCKICIVLSKGYMIIGLGGVRVRVRVRVRG